MFAIAGKFAPETEGYNVWDYLPQDAHSLRFEFAEAAIAYARTNSLGPDADGVEPTWLAREI